MTQKIIPHLWYDKGKAIEAAEMYVDVFGRDSKVLSKSVMENTPSGDVETVSFKLWDMEFAAISAGTEFTFNPSISFMVNFDPSLDKDAKNRIDTIWEKLMEGGKALMPLQKYPFSERYGWVEDKYGLSWQLILTDPEGLKRPGIMPALLFVDKKCGKAKEARARYLSIFKDKEAGDLIPYPADSNPNKKGDIMFSDFRLFDRWFVTTDEGHKHGFDFNEAVSFIVNCKDQKEIDYYWEKLSAFPENEQCGWLKDKYGVSWQIVPEALNEMLEKGNSEQRKRVIDAFLKMKKFDINELKKVYDKTK